MEILHIIYIGSNDRCVRTIVDRAGYERNYKPKGWKIDTNYVKVQEDENIKELKTATKINNYEKMKRTEDKDFDDNLFKKD